MLEAFDRDMQQIGTLAPAKASIADPPKVHGGAGGLLRRFSSLVVH